MRMKLTERIATRLREQPEHSSPHDYFDSQVDGLCLTVRPTGAASWCLRYRVGRHQRRLTLGRSPSLGIEAARKAARHAIGLIALGRDPAAEKMALRRAPAPSDCYPAMAEKFIRTHAHINNRSWKEQARVLGFSSREFGEVRRPNFVLPAELRLRRIEGSLVERWAHMRVTAISTADVSNAVLELVELRKLATANARLAQLRSFFSWLMKHGYIERHPCMTMPLPSRPVSRDRTLTAAELATVWRAAERIVQPYRGFVRLLILTGQRRREVSGLEWSEVNGSMWVLPARRSKNGGDHRIPLAPSALAELALLPKCGPFAVTTMKYGTKPIGGYSKAKNTIDEAIRRIEPAGLQPWTFHDLRRTVATGMAALRIEPHVIEAVLNHRTGTISGLARIYNRHSYEAEKRAALEAWAAYVAGLVGDSNELPPAEPESSAA